MREIALLEKGLNTIPGNTATMQDRMDYFKVPGVSVAVIDQGKLHWHRTWGKISKDDEPNLSLKHLMYACSTSKFITAMVAVGLAQRGEIDLDTDVNNMLRSWKLTNPFDKAVTLRLLLSHQAGILDGDNCFSPLQPGQKYPTLIEIIEGRTPVSTKPLTIENPPGTFAYSDNGFCLAQLVLEQVTGKTMVQLAEELIFQPLAMIDSTMDLSSVKKDLAIGHDPDGNVSHFSRPIYPFPAAAGLWCTSKDLALALIELVNALKGRGEVLSKTSAEALIQQTVKGIGLGNFSESCGESFQIYHLGWGEGFQCQFVLRPYLGQGAVVMINSNPGVPQDQSIVGEIIRGLARIYNWKH